MNSGNNGKTSALYVWNGLSMFWGTSFHTDPHFHNTLQLVFDIEKQFKLKDEDHDWQSYASAIIKEGHIHQLESCNSIQLFIYLDKDSRFARELSKRYLKGVAIAPLDYPGISKLGTQYFKELLVETDCTKLFKGCRVILQALLNIEVSKILDERVKKAIEFITGATDKQMKVKAIALSHLFKEEVGQPIQNFMLWMKVVDSLNLVLSGEPMRKAAINSGFWDNSHMHRSYKELLGVPPGKIKTFEKDLKIVACESGNLHTLRTEILDPQDTDIVNKIIEI